MRAAVDELHAAGVKVLIPYNPWDIGTRRCGAGATCGGSENHTNATAVCNVKVRRPQPIAPLRLLPE